MLEKHTGLGAIVDHCFDTLLSGLGFPGLGAGGRFCVR
jgi:hypothetical protein